MSKWVRARTDFAFTESRDRIGFGRFSDVFAVDDQREHTKVALKLMRSAQLNETARQYFNREVCIMATKKHETILEFFGYIPFNDSDGDHAAIITELMPNHSLKELIEKPAEVPAAWDNTQKTIALYGIAVGMRFLHGQKVQHRDLKPENVLLNEAWEPKIADFGFSKLEDPLGEQTQNIGSQAYMAPEMLKGEDYSFPIDVYAYAVLTNAVLSGQAPFSGRTNQFALTVEVLKGDRPAFGRDIDGAWRKMIKHCWEGSPEHRPTFAEIVDELSRPPFLQPIDVVRFLQYQRKVGTEPGLWAEAENLAGIRTNDEAERLEYFRRSMDHGSLEGLLNYALATGDARLIEKAKDGGSVRAISYYADSLAGDDAAELYREAADKGDGRAQAKWGHLCELAGNVDEAVKHYKLAADQGDRDGLFDYGRCLAAGTGVVRDLPAAIALFKRAADQGHVRAQYLYGWHVRVTDPAAAAKSFECAAKQGDADAQFQFANTLTDDLEQAAIWYRRSADQGHIRSQTALGFRLERGIGGRPDAVAAVEWYQKAANRGDPRALCDYASCLAHGIGVAQDDKKAARYFKFSADLGDPRGQVWYADCRERGFGIPQDFVKTAEYCKRAADQGYAEGEFRFARCLAKGIGVERDPVQAAQYYQRAADRGHAAAQCSYGWCLFMGKGVEKDTTKAAEYFERSAENNDPHGQSNFAYCLEVGMGTRKDLAKSAIYYRRSADQGDRLGQEGLSRSARP